MATVELILEDEEETPKQKQGYVLLSSVDQATRDKMLSNYKPPNVKKEDDEPPEIVKSKVIVINSIKVVAEQDAEGNFSFEIKTEFGKLSDGSSIEGIDITANEDIEFDENMTLKKLNTIVRRCGILEKYGEYFVPDPEIVVNSYEISVKKQYRFFEEFNDGIQTVSEIFE
jgi:hypothetical protein